MRSPAGNFQNLMVNAESMLVEDALNYPVLGVFRPVVFIYSSSLASTIVSEQPKNICSTTFRPANVSCRVQLWIHLGICSGFHFFFPFFPNQKSCLNIKAAAFVRKWDLIFAKHQPPWVMGLSSTTALSGFDLLSQRVQVPTVFFLGAISSMQFIQR